MADFDKGGCFPGDGIMEIVNTTRTLKCSICCKDILRGEKYTWRMGVRGYVNLCSNCLIKLGELGKSIEQYNKDYLAQPLKIRLKKLKMMEAITKDGN